jgi:hypothetical protein
VSARRKPTPSYLPHKQSGRARAVWTDALGLRHQKLLPGPFDSPESRTAFATLQLELETSPAAAVADPNGITVAEVLAAYLVHAERYYADAAGNPTSEVTSVKRSIKPVRELYAATPAAAFGPRALAAVRQHMIDLDWCRSLVNKRIDRVKRAFRWAVAEELVPAATYEALRTLPGLRRGRTEAKESDPVRPVADAVVTATLPHLAATPCHLGGVRWWLACPLARDGVGCGRRARKLYLRGRYFGCRHCHGLTYTSTQESDGRVYAALRGGLDLGGLDDLRGWSASKLGLALKVLAAERQRLGRLDRRTGRRRGRRKADGEMMTSPDTEPTT